MNTTHTLDPQDLAQTIATAVTTAVLAALEPNAPAKAAQPEADAPKFEIKGKGHAHKGAPSVKDWNRSFAAKCRARKGAYGEAMERWAEVTQLRDAGKTPAQARKALLGF